MTVGIFGNIFESQNQHGRDLQGQSAISFSCFGPRVALFSEREPWALKQSTHFTIFAISENYFRQLCSCLWPPRGSFFRFLILFDEFSALYSLFITFILYCQNGSAASVQVDMQIEAAARLKSTLSDLNLEEYFVWGPPSHIFPKRPSLWVS